MAVEFRHANFAIPAGTAIASPFTQTVTFPTRVVDQITVKVPPGPSGLVGFAIGNSGAPVIPIDPGQWIVADNDFLTFELDNFWDSGSWELFGYNLGAYLHTLYFTFFCDLVPQPAPPSLALVSTSLLSSSAAPLPVAAGASSALATVPTVETVPTT